MSELRCVKKSPSVGRIDGIINREAPQRRSHKHKEKKDRKGRKEELIKCWIVEFIVHRAASSSIALARPADPSFFFFFFKNHRENTVCQFPWRRTRRFMAALKSILSNDSCSLTFCQIRGLFGRVYLSQQHRPLHGYSQCSGTKGKEGEKKSPVNYVCAIFVFWMCICGSLRRLNELISTRRLRGHAEEKGRKHCFYISMWTRTRVCAFSLCREKSADIHQETELTIDYQV